MLLVSIFVLFLAYSSESHHKFDKNYLPFDLKPVANWVGRWEFESLTGYGAGSFPFGKILEFGIDPLPHFGARCLNYTATSHHEWEKSSIFNGSRIVHFEYGYLPVNNRTKINPQILCAFLTTGSEGYAMIEYGMVVDDTIMLDLNKYLARSFGLGFATSGFFVHELHREFRVSGRRLEQRIIVKTNVGISDFSVIYSKKTP